MEMPETNDKKKRSAGRDQSGFSLVMALSLGIIGSLWVAGVMGFGFGSSRLVMNDAASVSARSTAEAGLDYVLTQLQASFANSAITNTYDATTVNTFKKSTVSGATVGNPKASLEIAVDNVPPTNGRSSVYKPTLDPTDPNANILGGVNASGWRVVTAVAKVGGSVRGIRVIMEPTYTTSISPILYPVFGRTGVTLTAMNSAGYDSLGAAGNSDPLGGSVRRVAPWCWPPFPFYPATQ